MGGLPLACRSFLREALAVDGRLPVDLDAHRQACHACAARFAARARIATALSRRPQWPSIPTATLLEGIFERIAEQSEQSPFGRSLATAMQASEAPARDWPSPIPEVALVEEMAATPPPAPSVEAWARVRRGILAHVSAWSLLRRRQRLLVGGIAAIAIVMCLMFVRSRPVPAAPEIVFADLQSTDLAALPSVEFAVLRYGAVR
jgi:hypothetical protein